MERSLIEVRDMFLRISALVIEQVHMIHFKFIPLILDYVNENALFRIRISQSPLITQIEYFAHQATLNIDKGAGKLEKAREMKIKRMKVIAILLCILCIYFKFNWFSLSKHKTFFLLLFFSGKSGFSSG